MDILRFKGGRRLKPLVSSFLRALKRRGFPTSRILLMNKLEELNKKLADLIVQQERAASIGRTKKADNLAQDITQLRSRIKSIAQNS